MQHNFVADGAEAQGEPRQQPHWGIVRPPRSYIVIPARLASTRLPGKMLLRRTGKSLIQHTYEAARKARRPLGVCIATDHELIAREVLALGGQVHMTDPALPSGTDRVAAAARHLDVDIVVNVQGDEPEISPEAIDETIRILEENPDAPMSTVATPIRDRATLENPACVKVVLDQQGRALYFSRAVIPYPRVWSDSLLAADPPIFHLHLGIYGYRRSFLLRLAALPPAPMERLECLEQLRVLAAGHAIYVGIVPHASRGIDTQDDYDAFVRRMAG